MTHTYKLARRMSRFRAASLASLLAVFAGTACSNSDPVEPITDVGVIEPEFATTGVVTITNIAVRSGRTYRLASGFKVGVKPYVDHSVLVSGTVPASLAGGSYIQTANADKNSYRANNSFLTFTISADANVYVAHDNRVARPTWLTTKFQDTGIDLATSDGAKYSVFKKTFTRGGVTIGSNATGAGTDKNMYFVIVQSIGTSGGGEGNGGAAPVVSGTGIPFGDFSLPTSQYSNPTFSGALRHLSPSSGLNDLANAKRNGARLFVSLAGGRGTYKNADGTFSMTKWKKQVDRWKSINLSPYINDGTIVGHYLIDEPNWAGGWGGKAVTHAQLAEMARYSKSIWPNMATGIRVLPSYLHGSTWTHLDFAWSQWAGPLHSSSKGMTPEAWRDRQISDAKKINVKLVFGINYLNGGDGSSKIAGTYNLKETKTRWQMTAAEVERVGKVLAAASYACGMINWRYSSDYPWYSHFTQAQHAGILAFHSRSDVKAALNRVSEAARNRPATSCKRGA